MFAAHAFAGIFTFQNIGINSFITLPLLFLVYRLLYRDNVARWLLTIISAVMLALLFSAITNWGTDPTTKTIAPQNLSASAYISTVWGALIATGLVLVFLPPSNRWFKGDDQNVA